MTSHDAKISQMDQAAEIWKRVPEKYGNYEVSSFGRLRRGDLILRTPLSSHGYPQKTLNFKDGSRKTVRIHRLVCLAFGVISESDIVNHIDGVKHNNHLSNLEKSNPAHNVRHAVRMGLLKPLVGEENGSSKLTKEQVKQIIRLYAEGNLTKEIAKKFGVTSRLISCIALGEGWESLNEYRKELGIKPRGRINGISTSGDKNGNSRLTSAQVEKIRLDNRRVSEIAREYKVAWTTINDIKIGRSWKQSYEESLK